MSEQDEEDTVRKWDWWRVSSGIWTHPDMDWLAGSLVEMVKEYGGYEKPIIEIDESGLSIIVFSLDRKYISPEVIEQLNRHNSSSNYDEAKDDAWSSWEDDSPIMWLWYFEHVYPSSHLVFVHYDLIEAHGIFCETFKDMLEVVRLVRRPW